jgi:formate-dependent nitrite reductase membrane component NrfD
MTQAFNTELRRQEQWSWLVSIDLFLGGLGGGLFLLFEILDLPTSVALVALGLVLLGAGVLLAELQHPRRAWRAISRPRTSWISRGVIFVGVFTVSATLAIVPALDVLSPLDVDRLGGKIVWVIAGVAAAAVAVYPGFVLSASPSIPAWHSSILPFLFFAYSVTGASGILLLFSPVDSWKSDVAGIDAVAAGLLGVTLLLIAVHVAILRLSGLATRETLRLLTCGSLGIVFRGGVITAGLVLPLVLLAFVPWAVFPLVGVLVLVGALLFRYSILRSGVYAASPLG